MLEFDLSIYLFLVFILLVNVIIVNIGDVFENGNLFLFINKNNAGNILRNISDNVIIV